jgi:hypothetical protein
VRGSRPGSGRRSGGEGAADADLGDRSPGGQVRPAGRESRPGLGLPVAVPVAAGVDAAGGHAGQDGVAAGRGQRGGQAGGERDLAGCTTWPARLPLPAGTAMPAAASAAARAGSTAMIQAACSWATRRPDRSIGPVDGPASLIADLASFRQVSDRIHRLLSALFPCRDSRHRSASGPAVCAVRLPLPRCRLSLNHVRRASLQQGQANCDTGTTEHGECGQKPPGVGGGEHSRRVGGIVREVSDQVEQLQSISARRR